MRRHPKAPPLSPFDSIRIITQFHNSYKDYELTDRQINSESPVDKVRRGNRPEWNDCPVGAQN